MKIRNTLKNNAPANHGLLGVPMPYSDASPYAPHAVRQLSLLDACNVYLTNEYNVMLGCRANQKFLDV